MSFSAKRISLVSAFAIALFHASWPSVAQQVSCNAPAVEKTLRALLSQKYGPSAHTQLEAMAAGNSGPLAQVEITNAKTLGSYTNGFTCEGSVIIRRVDIGRVINVSIKYNVLTDTGMVQITASDPQ